MIMNRNQPLVIILLSRLSKKYHHKLLLYLYTLFLVLKHKKPMMAMAKKFTAIL